MGSTAESRPRRLATESTKGSEVDARPQTPLRIQASEKGNRHKRTERPQRKSTNTGVPSQIQHSGALKSVPRFCVSLCSFVAIGRSSDVWLHLENNRLESELIARCLYVIAPAPWFFPFHL